MPVHSFRSVSRLDSVAGLVVEFEQEWRHGSPRIEQFCNRLTAEESTFGLAELVKADLQQRYRRGERPSARDYFDRFPELTGENGHVLSLIYEEFCLRDEAGEGVNAAEFCDLYDTWRDSLVSQLVYHRELSRAVEPWPAGPDLPDVGDRFGDYHLVKMIGTGGSARVFLAHETQMGGREVVLKISRDRGGESAVLGKLDHDHIVAVYTTIVDPETGFRGLCMPYRPGLPLNEVLARFSRDAIPRSASVLQEVVDRAFPSLPIEKGRRSGWADFPANRSYADGVAWIGMKMAEALAHAHGQGIYHRDVKPENILLTRRDGPQLLDFNLSHDSTVADQARAAQRGGTLPYMAREQLEAFKDPLLWKHVGVPADLFSLGLILREMLTLRSPARPPANISLTRTINDLIQKRAAPQVPIRQFNPKVPHALEAIVAKCLAESPEDRYRSAQELADDLRCFLDRRDLKVARNPSRREIACNHARRRARLAGVAAAIALVVGLIFVAGHYVAPIKPPLPPQEETTREIIQKAWMAHDHGQIASSNQRIKEALQRPDVMSAFRIESQGRKKPFDFTMDFAQALCLAGLFDKGAAVYRSAMEIDPSSSAAAAGRARAELSLNQFEPALGSINQAISLLRKDASPEVKVETIALWLIRARVFLSLGDAAKDEKNLDTSRTYLTRAVVDLDAIGAINEVKPEARVVFTQHSYYAAAKASLGEIAYHFNDIQVASDYFQAALNHIKTARATGVGAGYGEYVDDLEKLIKVKQKEAIID